MKRTQYTRRPEGLLGKVFSRQTALLLGLSDRQLAGPGWHRLVRGIYADGNLDLNHGLRIVGAHKLLPTDLILSGPSAAWFQGARLAKPQDPVHVQVPRGRKFGPVQGVRVHTSLYPIQATDLGTQRKWQITQPLRTAWDLGCWLPIAESLPYLDSMLAAGTVNKAQLIESANDRPRLRYSSRARKALNSAIASSGSPAESRLRALLIGAELPPPVTQFEVFDGSGFVARVDFAWPEHFIALEYEGSYHASVSQFSQDRRRLSKLGALGWTVLFATKEHAYGNRFPELLANIQTALSRPN